MEIKKISCPFCNELSVESEYFPGEVRHRTTRIRSRTSVSTFAIPEKYKVLSGCDKCGKTENEIRNVVEKGESTMTFERKKQRVLELEELKKQIRMRKE